ncbi:MAG: helix-turn-helix domain-containing protein, partial [Firmicutes bacterium]|nr:helix-turn-helix domain-containing protein [Bacillota bacterium]
TDAAVGMLEPLVEYDADNNGSLLETLEKYMLDCNQDYRNTADCMYIHVNTVQYRVKRALEIIGINYKVSVEMYTLYDSLVIHRLMMIDDQN